jgi:hypothetical protein
VQVPAPVLRPTGLQGLVHLGVRPTSFVVLGREDDPHVLADDLVFPEAQDPLGTGVPGRDAALAVGREDGVVPGALDHEAVDFVAQEERGGCGLHRVVAHP